MVLVPSGDDSGYVVGAPIGVPFGDIGERIC